MKGERDMSELIEIDKQRELEEIDKRKELEGIE